MTITIYLLLIIGSYFIIRDIYKEEHNIKEINWLECLFIWFLSLFIFFGWFVIMAYNTLKYPPHEEI